MKQINLAQQNLERLFPCFVGGRLFMDCSSIRYPYMALCLLDLLITATARSDANEYAVLGGSFYLMAGKEKSITLS